MTLCPQTPPPKRKRIVSEDVLEAPGQKMGGGGYQNCNNAGLQTYSCCLVAARKHRISDSEVENWVGCICEQIHSTNCLHISTCLYVSFVL